MVWLNTKYMINSEYLASAQDHQDVLESAMNKLNPSLYLLHTKTAGLHIQVTFLEAKGIVVKPSTSAQSAVAPAGHELVHEGLRKLLE